MKLLGSTWYTFLLCIVWHSFVFAQQDKKDSLTLFAETLRQNPREQVFLHLDRTRYRPGDTVYLKAYTLYGSRHILSALSGVLHVDALRDDSTTLTSIKLQLKNGVATGIIPIPSSEVNGTLHIRAYTRWMLNEHKPIEFTNVYIGMPAITNSEADAVISFMPEGRNLLNGVLGKVAFRITGSDGLGLAASGRVIDDKNNIITSFTTTHNGMGSLELTPVSGHSYYAEVVLANGNKRKVLLPQATDNGLNFKVVTNEPGNIIIQVDAGTAYFAAHKNENLQIVSQWQGKTGWFTGKLAAPSIRFQLKDSYPTGVLYLTVLDDHKAATCERMLFVNNPSDNFGINAITNKPAYKPYDNITVDISALDKDHFPVSASVSITKTDTLQNIPIAVLLTNDLVGYIEDPGYYFNKANTGAKAALDLLMLTHKYERYTIKQFLAGYKLHAQYPPEKTLSVTGFLKTEKNKPLAHRHVLLSDPVGNGATRDTLTNDLGFFTFNNILYTDSTAFNISSDANGAKILPYQENLNVVMGTMAESTSSPGISKYKHSANTVEPLRDINGKFLKEVKIKYKKALLDYETQSLAGAGNADQVVFIKDIHGGGNPSDVLNGLLRGVIFVHGIPYLTTSLQMQMPNNPAKPMLIIVDGAYGSSAPDTRGLDDFFLRDIQSIEVLKSGNASIYGMEAGGGVLIITTTKGESKEETPATQLSFKNMGFATAKDFYVSKYDQNAGFNNPINFRSTIFWKPELLFDNTGKVQLQFQHNGLTGQFTIVVNGISADGKPMYGSLNYTVSQ